VVIINIKNKTPFEFVLIIYRQQK